MGLQGIVAQTHSYISIHPTLIMCLFHQSLVQLEILKGFSGFGMLKWGNWSGYWEITLLLREADDVKSIRVQDHEIIFFKVNNFPSW